MSEPVPTSVNPDSLHRDLVDGLVADLRPVRPLWPVRIRFMLWACLEIAILAGAVVIYGARHDLLQQLHSPLYVAELLGFMAAGVFSAALALKSAVPGIEPTRLHWLVLVTVITAAVLTLAEHPASADVSLSQFIHTGIGCVETARGLSRDLVVGKGGRNQQD